MEDDKSMILEKSDKKHFRFTHNEDKYIFTCSKKGNNSLLFDLRLDSDIVTNYYELDYDIQLLKNLSEIFIPFSNLEEVYNFLTDNFKRYEKDIKLEFFLEKAKLIFKVDSSGKKEVLPLFLNQKENNISNLFHQLNSKIKIMQKAHNNLEEKIKENNEFIIKKDTIEKELNNKIKEIEGIKKECKNIQKNYKDNENKINEINKIKKDRFQFLAGLSSKKRNEDKEKNLETRIDSMKENMDLMKINLDENGKILSEINDNIDKCQNQFYKLDEEINDIKINENNINQSISDNMEIDDDISKEIENLQKENSEIQKKLEENDKNLNLLNKILKDIENSEKLEKKTIGKKIVNVPKINKIEMPNKEIDVKENPIYFKFEKTITKCLCSYNYNSVCIFPSFEDQNIYIVFGVRSLDLKYYDLKKNQKYILFSRLHKKNIDSCRHFYEESNRRDLIITTSSDNHVKVINFIKKVSEIILDLDLELNRNEKVAVNNACIINGTVMIPFSYSSVIECYNLNSIFIGKIENIEIISDLTVYHFGIFLKDVALVSNNSGIYCYIIDNLTLYHKFESNEKENGKEKMEFNEAHIIEGKNKIVLVGPQFKSGNLYLWDFKSGVLINLINIGLSIYDICIWDNNFILAFSSKNKSEYILINIYSQSKRIYNIGKIEENPEGKGIKLLRHNFSEGYLISCTLSGKLNLFNLESIGL